MTGISKNDEIDSTVDPLKLLLEAKKDELSTPIAEKIGFPGHEAKARRSAKKIAESIENEGYSVEDLAHLGSEESATGNERHLFSITVTENE